MKIEATRIVIRSAEKTSFWYFGAINEQFWALNNSELLWEVIPEGADFPVPLYVNKCDAEPLRKSLIDVKLVQIIEEC